MFKQKFKCVLVLLLVFSVVIIGFNATMGTVSKAATVAALMADSVVDSIGINNHWDYTTSPDYTQYNIIKTKLGVLGIRHVRARINPNNSTVTARLQDLYDTYGITILGGVDTRDVSAAAAQSYVESFNSVRPGAFDIIEGPNEVDIMGDNTGNFEEEIYNQYVDIWNAFKGDTDTDDIPISGVLLGHFDNYDDMEAAYPNIHNYLEWGNMHSYCGKNPPESVSSSYVTYLQSVAHSPRPFLTGEAGFCNFVNSFWDPSKIGVNQNAAAKLLPRMIMDNFMKGFSRTYIFEIIDDNDTWNTWRDAHWGLLTTNGSEKLQYTSLKNFIDIMEDPGDSFTTGSLDFTLSDTNNLQYQLLQKRDGTFYLVLWQNIASWNYSSQVEITNPDKAVTLTFAQSQDVNIYIPKNSASAANTYTNVSSVNLSVPDHIMIVEIGNGGPTPTPSSTATPITTPTPTPTPVPGQQLTIDTATAQDAEYAHPASHMIDGNYTSTYWSAGTANGSRWIKFDLGSTQSISKVKTAFVGYQTIYYTYNIQVSTDDTNWTTVIGTKTSTCGNQWEQDTFSSTNTRYVMMNIITDSSPSLKSRVYEVEIYQ